MLFRSISAGAVYDNSNNLEITEQSPVSMFQGNYAQSKLITENMYKHFSDSYSVPVSIIRLFNTYGPRQEGDFLIPSLISKAIKGDFEVWNGSVERDFNYVDDIVNLLLRTASLHAPPIINGASGTITPIARIADMIAKFFDVDWINLELDTFGPKKQLVNSTLAKKSLGWNPNIEISEGIHRCCEYYLKNGFNYEKRYKIA